MDVVAEAYNEQRQETYEPIPVREQQVETVTEDLKRSKRVSVASVENYRWKTIVTVLNLGKLTTYDKKAYASNSYCAMNRVHSWRR